MTIPAVPMQLMVETKQNRADLYISGNITKGAQFWGMTFKEETDVEYNDVAEALKDLPDEVSEIGVHINSYGGEVAEGVAIYNALRVHQAHVTTVCEGFACSIASVIFMAGDERVMRDSSLLMLHNASMPAYGDANDHRKAADDLDVITELSKTAYLSHATESLTREKLDEVMDAETWVTPEQALEWGLATEIDKPSESDEPTQSAARYVMDHLLLTPDEFGEVVEGFDFEPWFKLIKSEIAELRNEMQQASAAKDSDVQDGADDAQQGAVTRLSELFGILAKDSNE